MKLQFDANQQFQINAVAAVADLFEGQPQGEPQYAVINVGGTGGLFAGQEQTELGVGNRVLLALAHERALADQQPLLSGHVLCAPCPNLWDQFF